MRIVEVLKPFFVELDSFLSRWGDIEHHPLDEEDIGKFYIMICEDGSYYQVDMNNSYWYVEDDGCLVFRVNDDTDNSPHFIDGSDVPVCGGYE